ncbi:MAG: hypothetical protein OQJ89_06505 [Kangiellaceae bacterium]|nr:hypothetical protein [Kangiellaceae bacterium]MCW8997861.1 hypothetical protein [Kangiellaceae bacterium]MCW9016594.1 hypothetical protein [Kangiellaceae bacterium]
MESDNWETGNETGSKDALTKMRRITSLSEIREEALLMFSAAQRKIQIYTDNLDPRILNTRDVERTLINFVRKSRNVRIEILIIDERNVQSLDHRLVSLAQKYTSFISIKVIPKDYHENHFAFYLIDGRKLIYRTIAERFESEVHQIPSVKLKQMSKYFDEVWEQSSPAIHLRALII